MWGTTKDGQDCHHLPPTPTDHGEGMQTTVASSPDTMSTLSITTLAPTPSTTQAFRLEQPSRGRMTTPQAKDNKSLTQIRTQQVDKPGYLLERGSYPSRYKQREADNSGTPPEHFVGPILYGIKVPTPLVYTCSSDISCGRTT